MLALRGVIEISAGDEAVAVDLLDVELLAKLCALRLVESPAVMMAAP
ncbi:hypothetical protein [Streptomyces sp. NPDC056191]